MKSVVFSLEPSRSGLPCCLADGNYLHSAYDPEKEARRFIDSSLGTRRPARFVLLGPCLDYISPLLRQRFPESIIFTIDYDGFFASFRRATVDHAWNPSCEESLEGFLSSRMDEDCVSGLAILEWPPSARIFPAPSRAAAASLRSALSRLSSSAATLRTWGRRWILNACRSFLLAERMATFESADLPVVVAAAGPSLVAALSLIAPWRDHFVLLAVSSALAACRFAGLEPDLVVATDGGPWSRWHLYPLAQRACPLASPLAATPSTQILRSSPLVLIEQGNFPERELSARLGGGIRLPSHGTVSGTALRLAAATGTGPILAVGLDLANYDIISHASPHGFDLLPCHGDSRLSAHEGKVYGREIEAAPLPASVPPWRSSRSLEIYAQALAAEAEEPLFEGRLARLLPSPVRLRGYDELGAEDIAGFFAALPQGGSRPDRVDGSTAFLRPRGIPSHEEREAMLLGLLGQWKEQAHASTRELAEGRRPCDTRIREMLMAVDLPDWAAAHRAMASGLSPSFSATALGESTLAFLDDLERRLFPWKT